MSVLPDRISNQDEISYYEDKTWVQCEAPGCLKWRLVTGADLDQDKPWFCNMNPDTLFSHCSVPQGAFPNESHLQKHGLKMVYSLMPVGSFVLVNARCWPRWPAILCPDPNEEEYARLGSDGYVEYYHVEFLGKPHTRYWAAAKYVEPYSIPFKKPHYRTLRGAIKKSYEVAMEEATKVKEMGCQERLEMCHFRPQELLAQAQTLMHSIDRMLKQSPDQTESQVKITD
ncbi:hypothetical protein UPYG_G00304900 [Umbra pygmaea]|uniref:CW-type domain-containing protein n=1 Tax=Umbra pygmaea TaxID=75934 RepID=A0ABD0WI16_UMBPY